ncbi:MAG TPA: rod shape-determining protein MreC [Candidatus Saccharimonadales bacterium]|nr:rod shape-determining protein MreC [Candidatus Saccharimonadales bacterium]HUC85940.1 rod shape-determining protein MreC [Candidatus Acidoferrales bacterium]
MFKKKHYLALGAVVLAALLIFSLPQRAASRLKLAIGSLFLPLFGLLNTAQQLPVDAADAVMPRHALLKEIGELQSENQQLRIQMMQTAAATRENDQLRALVGWQRQAPWKLKLANVVMRDPANWWRTVQIDIGSRDGVVVNMPVLTTEGLVGRVSSVAFTRSQVVLIGDPNCRVSALVENPAHDIGIITASGPVDSSLVDLTYLSGNADLKPGENVVTSGEGGIFPRGIPIGQVVDSRPVEFGLYTEARVKLSVNLGTLEQVWVLFR